jgi:hypothetical protein
MQFAAADVSVAAPQSLTRQLQDSDDRTRAAALGAIGAPAAYITRGHVALPHSLQLNFASLGLSGDLDAILTVELSQHIVCAILVPVDGAWRRIATIVYPTSFPDTMKAPSEFLQVQPSLIQPGHSRAVYRATVNGPNGEFVESDAELRILHNRAVITFSFTSGARTCEQSPHAGCEITERWLETDPMDPAHRFLMVTGSGRLTLAESANPLSRSHLFQLAHLRTFTCQEYLFSGTTERFEPTTATAPCSAPR